MERCYFIFLNLHIFDRILKLHIIYFLTAYDLQIAKHKAYDFDKEALSLIYSNLKNRKQSVRINNVLALS